MNLEFDIQLKPIGLNNSYFLSSRGKNKPVMRIKTDATRLFERKFDARMNQYQKELDEFNSFYNDHSHYIVVDYLFYIPVLTKDGKKINQRSGDVDGLIKVAQDCLFKRLKCDDSAIVYLTACKIHATDPVIKIKLSLRDINTIK